MAVRLQVALDVLDIERALRLVEAVRPWVDEIEVGSPLLVKEGVAAIRAVRSVAGDRVVIADTKIADSGGAIARLCFDAGAHAVTVLAQTSQKTLTEARAVADEYRGRIWLDLIGTENPVVRATVMAGLVDGFIAHRPPAGLPRVVVSTLLALNRPVRLAGGLNLATLERLRGLPLDGIIVGSAILKADDPASTAAAMHEMLRGF
jgi:3-hexulose-6-phosphate synthase